MKTPTRTKRRTVWAAARKLRNQLRPVRTQREVAELLGNSKQSVEVIELKALAKVLLAFAPELTELSASGNGLPTSIPSPVCSDGGASHVRRPNGTGNLMRD